MKAQDIGTGYDRKPSTYNAELTEVGRGTPMGELLRRYWHPVGLAADAGTTPKAVRVLGEDLILFRDGQGRPGSWTRAAATAAPRSTTAASRSAASAAAITAGCSTCEGHCLEQPCEPDGGRSRDRIRQPWYPGAGALRPDLRLHGPAGEEAGAAALRMPGSARAGEMVEADDTSIGRGGGTIVPCNWLQHYENLVDAFHVPILHGAFSGVQFVGADGHHAEGDAGTRRRPA